MRTDSPHPPKTATGAPWLLLLVLWAVAAGADNGAFPRPMGLEPDIAFWKRIYTGIDTNGGLIHDAHHLQVVYQVIRFEPEASGRERTRAVKEAKARYAAILRDLAAGKAATNDPDVRRVRALWPAEMSGRDWLEAEENLRFQLGQADKFRAGLIRAGAWIGQIRAMLRERGLPVELAALPHVESSFNPEAWSKVGAAGLWQFTRSTGRRFMRVDHVVDERMDPLLASDAAARLLEYNHATLGSWPLALTAYNHGVAGMRRAVAQLETDDIETIVRTYASRRFGFASRNFYVAFLAALDADTEATHFFGPIQPDPPVDHAVIELPAYLSVRTLQDALGISASLLRDHNPALMDAVWRGHKHVPKGYPLRLPRNASAPDPQTLIASIDRSQRHPRQKPDVFHTVRRGDTLSQIATRYGYSVGELMTMNNLRSQHRIRAGQVLRLPVVDSALVASGIGPEPLPENGTYRVRRGDSLWEIARRFDLDEQALALANGIDDARRLVVGQELQVALLQAETPETEETVTDLPAAPTPELADSPAESGPDTETAAEETAPAVALLEGIALNGVISRTAEEPVEAEAVEQAEAGTLATEQPDLSADPADYSVAEDLTVEVQATETLGHYADWLELRTQRLRNLNGLAFSTPVVYGRRLKLDFSRVDVVTFEQRRTAYHRERQERFFLRNQIGDTVVHTIRPGESIWVLTQRRYRVPMWLLRQYNPDINLERLRPGTRVRIPILEARVEEPTHELPSVPVERAEAQQPS